MLTGDVTGFPGGKTTATTGKNYISAETKKKINECYNRNGFKKKKKKRKVSSGIPGTPTQLLMAK